ncbi:Imm1 family immunity protein [Amycolatopsis sp. QT-25]|uniref:Imm1 family immunity protein n=1 Tax=Amycolatopsis sp. QT-25 TaxID=3034022 RepID=UPI0023EBC867|nr:Imm1 family immunity protein [Amycolatopsis sp. QT-25]WET78191.1 Imm1 family immunity protein [Amycolatopsis sp. QT-25]
MVTLEVWYNQEPDNDYAEGDPAIIINTPEELDALITQVQSDTKGLLVPSMINCAIAGDPKQGVFDMGIGQEKGFLMFMTPRAAQTQGDGPVDEYVVYDYMGHVREIPASCEIPMEKLRPLARKYLLGGNLPEELV